MCVEQNMGVLHVFNNPKAHQVFSQAENELYGQSLERIYDFVCHHNGFMLVKLSFSEYQSFGVCSFGFIYFGTRYHS